MACPLPSDSPPCTDHVSTPIAAFKAFDGQMQCKGFQYGFGRTYQHEGRLSLGAAGFHATSNLVYSFGLYPPGRSIYGRVEQSGSILEDRVGMRCSSIISIIEPVSLMEVTEIAIGERLARCTPVGTERIGLGGGCDVIERVASSTPSRPAAVVEGARLVSVAAWEDNVATADGEGVESCAVAHWSVTRAAGYCAASVTTSPVSASAVAGPKAVSCATQRRSSSASDGNFSISCITEAMSASEAKGWQCVSIATGQLASSRARGYRAASLTNNAAARCSVEGADAAAIALDPDSRAKAGEGGILVLSWWEPVMGVTNHSPRTGRLRVSVAYVGENGIKPDTWYRCSDRGEIVEA